MADADPRMEKAATAPDTDMTIETELPAIEKKRRSWVRPLLMFGVPLLVVAIAGYFWLTSGKSVSTDNAYVHQDKVSISPDVSGRIVDVAVQENQHVKKGQLLFRIDPEPYKIALAQANAAIADAQVQVHTLQTSYHGTGADIDAARDALASSQETFKRQQELMKQGFTTRASYDDARHAVEQAKAKLDSALSDAQEAKAKLATGSAVPGENPQIAAAKVERDKALLNLKRTEVRAPVDGIVSQVGSLQVGQQMMTGLSALTIVADGHSWVEANFKETELDKMCPGQPATIKFDSYSGVKLKGHVQSIGAGTGSEFSVLPAQNANGNWVKVTQRIPVRVAIDQKSPRQLIAGQSADVTVDLTAPCK